MTSKLNQLTKVKWMLLLFTTMVLFAIALMTGKLYLNIVVIGLALLIYKYGNPILFKEYEASRRKKLSETKKVQAAVSETLQQKKLFKKNKGEK